MDASKICAKAIDNFTPNQKGDITIKGKITEALANNKYKVFIKGQEYIVPSMSEAPLFIGDIAYITCVQGNFNDKYIVNTKSKGDTLTVKHIADNIRHILSEEREKWNKNITDLINHINDKTNPHNVTKEQVGLGKVDNTSDMEKPVSTAQQTAINNSLQIAKDYTDVEIANKVDKVDGKVLSENDLTDELLEKLNGIEVGATKTTIDSSLSSTSINPVQNKVVTKVLSDKAATNHTQDATTITIADKAGNYSSTNVEGALTEIATVINEGSFLYGELSEYVEDTRIQSNSAKVWIGTYVCGSIENGFNLGVADNSWSTSIFDFNFELDYLPTNECGGKEYSRLLGKFKITFQLYAEYSSEYTQIKGASYNIKVDYENYTTYGENRIDGILFTPYEDEDGNWKVDIYIILVGNALDGAYRFANNFDIAVTYSKYSNPYNIKRDYDGGTQSGYGCGADVLIDGETTSQYYISIFNGADNRNLQYGTEILDLIISE